MDAAALGLRPVVPPSFALDESELESLPAAFAAVCARHADRIAVVDRHGRLRYDDLDRMSRAVAAMLDERLGARGEPVAVLASHDRTTVVAMLAVARTGRPYCVLDALAPDQHHHDVVQRLGAHVVVTDAEHASVGAALVGAASVVVVSPQPVDASADATADPVVDPSAPVSLSFTSGSSGTPKAVVHRHAAVVQNGRRIAAVIGAGPEDCWLAASPLAFAGGVTPLFGALMTGGAVWTHLVADEGAASFAGRSREVAPAFLTLTPAMVGPLCRAVVAGGGLDSVRLVMVGGDRLDFSAVHQLHRAFPRAGLMNRYASSETNTVAGVLIDPERCPSSGPVPAGWTFPWLRTDVVDEAGCVVPDGAEGELVVTGPFVALGYWGDPERTAERFADGPGGRSYRTRDRFRRSPDGMLEHLGRVDITVKVRDVLVDPVVVERCVAGLDEVDGVAVVPAEGRDGSTRLVAFVVGGRIRPHVVRRHVSDHLPRAMVPSVVVQLDALPTTPQGKVDRARLGERAAGISPPSSEPPAGLHEQVVAARFEEILLVPNVGRHDDFFELGGDSLAAIELAEAMLADHGASIDLLTLMERPTPAMLARWLADAKRSPRALVRVTSGAPGRPLVVLFPGGGGVGVLGMHDLVKALGDVPSYLAVPWAFEHRGLPDRSLEQRAGRVVSALEDLSVDVPIVFIGKSGGGVVAVEAAAQLAERGAPPPLVVMLDSYSPAVERQQLLRARLRRIRAGGGDRWSRSVASAAAIAGMTRFRLGAFTAGWLPRRGRKQELVFRAHGRLLHARYRGRSYDGKVLLLRAADRDRSQPREQLLDAGWRQYLTGAFDVVEVPGRHGSMARPPFVEPAVAAIHHALSEAGVAIAEPGARSQPAQT